VDKYANQVNDKNYPDTTQLGDVTKAQGASLAPIGLLVGGSPEVSEESKKELVIL